MTPAEADVLAAARAYRAACVAWVAHCAHAPRACDPAYDAWDAARALRHADLQAAQDALCSAARRCAPAAAEATA